MRVCEFGGRGVEKVEARGVVCGVIGRSKVYVCESLGGKRKAKGV